MSSDSQQGQVSKNDSQFSVDLKTNKIKKKTKKKKQRKPPKIITSSYKKQKCLHFNKGNCTKGQTCTFSHEFQPQSRKTICKYFLSNSCSKGAECSFSHSIQQYPCRFFHLQSRCNQNQQCRFSHFPVSRQFAVDLVKDNKQLIMSLWRDQKLNFVVDKNLKRQISNLISKQLTQQQVPKKQAFKGQLKLLVQNHIETGEQVYKPKLMDPRLQIEGNIQVDPRIQRNQVVQIDPRLQIDSRVPKDPRIQTQPSVPVQIRAPIDPRLKIKNQSKIPKIIKIQEPRTEKNTLLKSWINQIPERNVSDKKKIISKQRLQYFLYSFY